MTPQTHAIVRGDGDSPAVLFLHGGGLGTDAENNWLPAIERLAGEFHCIAPDLLGFGSSAHPDPAPEGRAAWLELWACQCIELIDSLGLERVNVVGNSAVGGAIALRLLARHSERVDRAVVLGGGGQPAGDADRSSSPRQMLALLEEPTSESMAAALQRFSAAPQLPASFERMVDSRVAHARRAEVQRSFAGMWTGDHGAPLADGEAASIDRPVLLVHGADDAVADPARSWALARSLPAAALVVVPAAGHWVHLDRPGDFTTLVSSFLRDGLLAAAPD